MQSKRHSVLGKRSGRNYLRESPKKSENTPRVRREKKWQRGKEEEKREIRIGENREKRGGEEEEKGKEEGRREQEGEGRRRSSNHMQGRMGEARDLR